MTNTREYPRAGSEKSVPVPVPAMSSTRITVPAKPKTRAGLVTLIINVTFLKIRKLDMRHFT